MSYVIRDEDGEVMRVVGRQEEAKQLIQQRQGWTFKYMKAKKAEEYKFEEALF